MVLALFSFIEVTGLFNVPDGTEYKHSWVQVPSSYLTVPSDCIVYPTVQQFVNPDIQPEGVAAIEYDRDVLVELLLEQITEHYLKDNSVNVSAL